MAKVVFIATAGEEVELIKPIYEMLEGKVEVLNIHTGTMCCDKGGKQAEQTLVEYGMKHKSMDSYGTNNMVDILKAEQPNMVIVGSDQEYIRRAFLYAAQGLGIQTVLLDLGFSDNITNTTGIAIKRTIFRLTNYTGNIIRKYQYLLRTVLKLKWGLPKILRMIFNDIRIAFTVDDARGTFSSQPIVVSGIWEKKILLERGVNPENIIITGHPRWGVTQNDNQKTRILKEELGINDNGTVILLLTCAQVEHGRWTVGMRNRFFNGVLDVVTPILGDTVKMVVKPHPTEKPDEYDALLDNNSNVILKRDLLLTDIIEASDLVLVGGYSFAVLEVAALQKPAIILNIYDEIIGIPYVDMGLAVEVFNLNELAIMINRYLYDKDSIKSLLQKTQAFFDENKYFADGKAATRIADIIMDRAK